jgi:hypothetical protein
MKHNNDFRFDLQVGQTYENQLAELLQKKIEVKRDFKAIETGNIFVEYQSRNKPSGLATSEAHYWVYWLSEKHFITIEKNELKKLCRKYLGTKNDVLGGDNNTSKGILLPIIDFLKIN